jgi:Zn-dependent protease with chaperone function
VALASNGQSATDYTAVFYDGLIARRRAVTILLREDQLAIVEAGTTLAEWRYADLREQDAPSGSLRMTAAGALELARLEIADPALKAEILRRSPAIRQTARVNRRTKMQVVGWSVAAAVSLILTAVYLVPLAADRVVPLIPQSVERHLGEAVYKQVQAIFHAAPCATDDGSAALATMQARLTDGLPAKTPFDIVVLSSPIPNAFALPGGRIYLLHGLIEKAENVDEVAGVLAHEIGHVAHHDGLRRLLQASSSSFLIGLLFGDVMGGSVLITLGQTVVNSAYSREQESNADAFAADLLLRIGRSPKPLGMFLARIAATPKNGTNLAFLQSHPLSEDRLAALSTQEPASLSKPILSDTQWRALKAICPKPPSH